jgi:hypothetical protein
MRGNSLLVQDVKAALWARVIYYFKEERNE